MSNLKISSNTLLLAVGALLLIGLTWMGYNSASKSTQPHEETAHTNQASGPAIAVNDASLPADANLDEVVQNALRSIQEGKETGNMSHVMNEGIMKLKAVVQRDTNHINAIYQLGLFSIESGQLENAKKRFEKLLLLQPENQEYKKTLQEIQKKLGN